MFEFTVSPPSRWWSLLSSWPGRPACWCTCLRRERAATAGPAPQTDSLRRPPAWRTPSPNGPAGIPLCPGTSSPLPGWRCSALRRTCLATDSSQGSEGQGSFYTTIIFYFGYSVNESWSPKIFWTRPRSHCSAFYQTATSEWRTGCRADGKKTFCVWFLVRKSDVFS